MLKSMNAVLNYIEDHLDETIEFDEVQRIAGVSEYHFRRIFSFLSGMALNEYVRYRRLSNAAFELQNKEISVTEMAFKYGYNSVDGFSRAFKEWCNISPSEIRKSTQFKAFPKLTFQLAIYGGVDMDYRIEEKEAFKMVGFKKRVPIVFSGENKEIVELAQSITPAQRQTMHSYANIEPGESMNASFNFDEGRMKEQGNLDHMIGVISTLEDSFEGFDVIEVPPLKWAIFISEGEFPKVMQKTWGEIFAEWLPSSDYELVDAPEICFIGDMSDRTKVRCENWIAVKKIK